MCLSSTITAVPVKISHWNSYNKNRNMSSTKKKKIEKWDSIFEDETLLKSLENHTVDTISIYETNLS